MAGTSHAQMICDLLARARGRVPARSLPPHVVASWRRCIEQFGMAPDKVRLPHVLTRRELAEVSAPIEDLVALARPEMERLFLRLRAFGFIVSLAERGGAVVTFRGSAPLPDAFEATRNVLGAVCREDLQGTGGIGTCLREGRPLVVDREEHFDARVTEFTCVAAPVIGATGEVAAVLNASCWRRDGQVAPELVLDILSRSARRITNRVFAQRHAGRRVVRISRFDDFADIGAEGRIAIDASDCVVDATAEALQLVGGLGATPIGMRIEELESALDETADAGTDARGRGRVFMRPLEPARPLNARPRLRDAAAAAEAPIGLCMLQGLEPRLEAQIARARGVVDAGVPILILGESGTGKTTLARALHEECGDPGTPFAAVNCAGLSPERLVQTLFDGTKAHAGDVTPQTRGTLLLDRVDELPAETQAILLGHPAMETARGGDRFGALRIVSTAGHDLEARMRSGSFRPDLYHRIAGLTVHMPPLRDRADIGFAIERVFREEARRAAAPPPRIDPVALRALRGHGWPGNFLELRLAARIAIAGARRGTVSLAVLPPALHAPAPAPRFARPDRQRAAIESALARTQWNVQRAAQLLRISRATLHRRIRALGLERGDRRRRAAPTTT